MRIEDIGREVKRIRKEQGMTQIQVAVSAGYTEAHICHLENSNNRFTVLSLCTILDVLGYELEFKKKDKKNDYFY